jgi:hypothetical protein
VAVMDEVVACKEPRTFKVTHMEAEALHRGSQTERGDDARWECSLGTGHVG